MRRAIIVLSLLAIAVLSCSAFAETSPLLPKRFAGWTKVALDQTSTDPSVADPTNAALLKEDGFTDFESAEYRWGDRKISVKAARFKDASGAYSAFTVYKTSDMSTVDMGGRPGQSLGASIGKRVIFYRDNVLVQVQFDEITAMSAAEIRNLAADLPEAHGPEANLPILPTYLPKQSYIKQSAKYVMGPVGLSIIGTPVPDSMIGWNHGAEVVTGKYRTSEGIATLTLISYPTPAIAGEHYREFETLNQNPPPASAPEFAAPLTVKRTGPIVVLTSGKISSDEAKSLLASVNYDANVTWNENTYVNKRDNVANLLVNIIALIGILIVLALGFGVAFGGARVLLTRLFPGKLFDRPEQTEFIELGIEKSAENLQTAKK